MTYTKQQAITLMNTWGKDKRPFLFVIDYEMNNIILSPLDEVNKDILYDFNGISNVKSKNVEKGRLQKSPMPYSTYQIAFEKAIDQLNYGNSFLLNLTFPTQIKTPLSLEQIFHSAKAKYKLCVKSDEDKSGFVCFSPEIFIKTKNGYVYSYPMKGTIDAKLPNAKEKILEDEKELAEHYTIVDLIRNDLSIISENVEVTKFRYVDTIKTSNKELLQVSSEIRGKLPEDFTDHLGNHLFALLPAGSISGAPKKKTVEIIAAIEGQKRGYYTGITGIFDGENIDAGVMIRFIEKSGEDMFYRSGCGITYMSNCQTEYDEMIDKVYLPE